MGSALVLAPYNDAMRLGMGFNSYTQSLRIDNAISIDMDETKDIPTSNLRAVGNPSQTVSYSSRVVQKLSDIVETLNISFGAAIKKGTVEVSGNSSTVDENKIKESDLNVIVSVKVQNQTVMVSEKSDFQPIKGIIPNSSRFNEVYGDSYISGFIEGGEFNGIITIHVLDRQKSSVKKVESLLKKSLGKWSARDFSLDSFDASNSRSKSASSALKDTETTVSVSWCGGGQVKNASTLWDIDSMFQAAAAFPASVAACPQRTWAIITKYAKNKSYVTWEESQMYHYSPLEYDNLSSFTAELFENYYQYKALIKTLQSIISKPHSYQAREKGERFVSRDIIAKKSEGNSGAVDHDATKQEEDFQGQGIPVNTATLIAVRAAMRHEMSKIVEAVDVLTKDPGILKRQRDLSALPKNNFVKGVIEAALGLKSPSRKATSKDESPKSSLPVVDESTQDQETKSTATGVITFMASTGSDDIDDTDS